MTGQAGLVVLPGFVGHQNHLCKVANGRHMCCMQGLSLIEHQQQTYL